MGECAMAGAECLVDLDRTLTDREMADLLRRNGMTPYYFVHLAVVELLVKDNPVASRCYLSAWFPNRKREGGYNGILSSCRG